MGIKSYEVVYRQSDWHVSFEEALFGPFRIQAEAIATAKGWAGRSVPSIVRVEIDGGGLETVWTSDAEGLPLVV